MDKVVDNIIALRKKHNKTLAQMAEELGIAVSNYRRVETKETALTIDRLYQIADIFGVSVIELLGANTKEKDEKIEDLQKKLAKEQTESGRWNYLYFQALKVIFQETAKNLGLWKNEHFDLDRGVSKLKPEIAEQVANAFFEIEVVKEMFQSGIASGNDVFDELYENYRKRASSANK